MQYSRRLFVTAILSLFLFAACHSPRHDTYDVDFSEGAAAAVSSEPDTTSIRVAIATVISPRESFVYYQELFTALGEHLDRRVEFKQRSSYEEVNELLAQNLVDMAFVCSGAYIQGADHMELMFVPVVNGLTYYRGYVIAHKNSEVHSFEDFKGLSFTFSDPMCFTGNLFVDLRLLQLGVSADDFFGEIVYSLSHDQSIQMVSRNMIDGAAVNGLIFDYMARYHPEYVESLKIIEKTPQGGIPPVVNSLLMPRELRREIQVFFTDMHNHDETRLILDKILVDRFVLAGDTLYDGLREIKNRLWQ
ncbi:MAG: PhnD/SsuA/transferrin family substrate-binding protein [Bacteroidales bacterium]|nr:PhnD/SsuA/transferrin family substrate-binding protein [Bacteroidales bacterium]